MNVMVIGVTFIAVLVVLTAFAAAKEICYAPIAITGGFDSIMARMKAVRKPAYDCRQERYFVSLPKASCNSDFIIGKMMQLETCF